MRESGVARQQSPPEFFFRESQPTLLFREKHLTSVLCVFVFKGIRRDVNEL